MSLGPAPPRAEDLLVGSPTFTGTFTRSGLASLYRGTANGPDAIPAWQFVGTQGNAATGSAVAPAGDINGDGKPDILVGAPLFNGPAGSDAGRVYLFLGTGSGPALAPSQTFDGTSAGEHFGLSVAAAGDIDADGFADVVVGAPGTSFKFTAAGAAFLYRGSPSGLESSPINVVYGSSDFAACGAAVSRAGDARDRHMRRVADMHVEAGEHDVVFDGRDDGGQRLAAGVYFVALDVAGERDVRKLVRLR